MGEIRDRWKERNRELLEKRQDRYSKMAMEQLSGKRRPTKPKQAATFAPIGCIKDDLSVDGAYTLFVWTTEQDGTIMAPQFQVLNPQGNIAMVLQYNLEEVVNYSLSKSDSWSYGKPIQVKAGDKLEVIVNGTGAIEKVWLTFFFQPTRRALPNA